MPWEDHISVPGDSWGDLHSRRNQVWGLALKTVWERRSVCQETGSPAKEAGEVPSERRETLQLWNHHEDNLVAKTGSSYCTGQWPAGTSRRKSPAFWQQTSSFSTEEIKERLREGGKWDLFPACLARWQEPTWEREPPSPWTSPPCLGVEASKGLVLPGATMISFLRQGCELCPSCCGSSKWHSLGVFDPCMAAPDPCMAVPSCTQIRSPVSYTHYS